MTELSHQNTPDVAEENAWFPSPYSLSQYIPKKTDFQGTKIDQPLERGKHKILVVCTDERYLLLKNGKMFSTGNHPVETMLPMMHLHAAGFDMEIVTLSGNPVKFEMWAMPTEDEAVKKFYQEFLPQFKTPKKLSDVMDDVTSPDSPYAAVFIPGGHGALINLHESRTLRDALNWALNNDKFIISLCHGPAGFLAGAVDTAVEDYPLKGYKIVAFPDALDEGANIAIGYVPGHLPYLFGQRLKDLGVEIINEGMNGAVHKDRKVLTGDSPLAANALGILAADEMVKALR